MKNLWVLLKKKIAKELKIHIEEIEEPVRYGDFAYPCFNLSKKFVIISAVGISNFKIT